MEKFQKILRDSQQFAAEYDEQLSSHLPMALLALKKIGASEEQIVSFNEKYIKHLEPQRPKTLEIHLQNWPLFLGKHLHNSAYREFFLDELKRLGASQCLDTYLPVLMKGVSGGAFHPLIRLGYALELNSDWEIAEALASWCMAYLELGDISSSQLVNPHDVLQSLYDLNQKHHFKFSGNNIFLILKNISENNLIKEKILFPKITLEEMKKMALQIYLSSADSFIGLHLITSLHALRIVEEKMTMTMKTDEPLLYMWQAFCMGYIALGAIAIHKNSKFSPEELPSWEQIFEVARNHSNDHVIKLVYTANEEFKVTGDWHYQLAAALKTKLI